MAYGYFRSETVQSGQVTGTLTDFPALFSRTHNDFRTVGNGGHVQNANGYDLNLFGDSGGAPGSMLKMETEYYNAATGQVIKWAKVPSIAVSTVVWWQYGDSGVSTNQDDPTNVWSSQYQAVYHMGDGSTLGLNDSTSHAYTLTLNPVSAGNTAAAGKIHGAGNDNAAGSQYFQVPNSLDVTAGNGSLAAWIKPSSLPGSGDELVGVMRGDDGGGGGWGQLLSFKNVSGTTYWNSSVVTTSGGAAGYACTSTSTASTGNWYRIWGTWDNTNKQIAVYVNGAAPTTAGTGGTNNLRTSGAGARIAKHPSGGNLGINGDYDEVYFVDGLITAAWIEADYNNQNAPTSFWGLGSEQTPGGGGGGPTRKLLTLLCVG